MTVEESEMIAFEKELFPYSKRYPTDCKDKTPNTKHMLNDKKLNVKLYSIFQQYSYAVEIKDESGKKIGVETRVNKDTFPSKKQLGILLGDRQKLDDGTIIVIPTSQPTIRKYWDYLFNTSEDNIYCPYVIEKDEYYILPERENKFSLVPMSVVDYLNTGFSDMAISIYLILYAMNKWVQYERERRIKEKAKKGIPLTEADKEKNYYVFTLKELASNLGMKTDNWGGRGDLWQFDIKRAKSDPSYRLGTIPLAMVALYNGGLIDWEILVNEEGHRMYQLTKVNTSMKTILPDKEEIALMGKVKSNRLANTEMPIPIEAKAFTPIEEEEEIEPLKLKPKSGHIGEGMDKLIAKLQARAKENN